MLSIAGIPPFAAILDDDNDVK